MDFLINNNEEFMTTPLNKVIVNTFWGGLEHG